MREPAVRGINLFHTREYVIQKHGEGYWNEVLETLSSDEMRAIWQGILIPTSSYPFITFKVMVETLARKQGVDSEQGFSDLYFYMADRSLNVAYKIFFKLSNPAFVFSKYGQLWKRFFEFGVLDVLEAEKCHAILSFTLPEIAVNWVFSACLGFSMRAVDLAGGRNLVQRLKSRERLAGGNWRLIFELTWEE